MLRNELSFFLANYNCFFSSVSFPIILGSDKLFDPARSSLLAGKTSYKQVNNTLNYLHSLRQHYKLLSLLLRVVNSVSRDSFALNAPQSDLNTAAH